VEFDEKGIFFSFVKSEIWRRQTWYLNEIRNLLQRKLKVVDILNQPEEITCVPFSAIGQGIQAILPNV
jgi:hypothetical protein